MVNMFDLDLNCFLECWKLETWTSKAMKDAKKNPDDFVQSIISWKQKTILLS